MRDNAWAHQMLDSAWDKYFSDVPQDNIVKIVWGKRARRQLGSLRTDAMDPSVSIITLNSLFKNPDIPEFVIEATVVHELIHYAHGFHSPLEQKYTHPHAGGVMRTEFQERGVEVLYVKQRDWLKQNWQRVVDDSFSPKSKNPIVNSTTPIVPKPFWFRGDR